MMSQNPPPAEYVRSLFRYEDGRLYWLNRPMGHFIDERFWKIWNTRYAGKEAGACSEVSPQEPRWNISINNKKYYRYVLVWVIHHGRWPGRIDHKDRNQMNDRIENLRECSQQQNLGNSRRKRGNSSGHKGVYWRKDLQKWNAKIGVDGRSVDLGTFNTIEEAIETRRQAATEQWGEFANEGQYVTR